jgi:glycosyltransferase involved in cell wall biosynthesis
MLKDFDYLWLTHPTPFARIQDIVPDRVKVVYDCMDDALAFPTEMSDAGFRDTTFLRERELVERSDAIIVSSEHLRLRLTSRYGADGKIRVVNNALHPEEGSRLPSDKPARLPARIEGMFKKDCFNICYLGTIAPWVDFDLILESLDRFQEVRYIFFGPCEAPLPLHDRIVHGGSVEHDLVFDIMDRADALVMPFRVDELVLSVNPVKLYEYSYRSTPSIAVKFDETVMFQDFVYLYDTREKYFDLMRRLVSGDLPLKGSLQERQRFAADNSWETRVSAISDIFRKF